MVYRPRWEFFFLRDCNIFDVIVGVIEMILICEFKPYNNASVVNKCQ